MVLWTLFFQTSPTQPWIRAAAPAIKEVRVNKRNKNGEILEAHALYKPGAFSSKEEAEANYRHILYNSDNDSTVVKYSVQSFNRLNTRELRERLRKSKQLLVERLLKVN